VTWAFLSNGDLPWNALPLLGGLIAVVTEVALAYRGMLPVRTANIRSTIHTPKTILAQAQGNSCVQAKGGRPWNALPLLGGLIAVVTEVALAYRAGKVRV
jgi:hypothetical protein